MEKNQDLQKKPITYYGKKAYRVHPLLARRKSTEPVKPDYQNAYTEEKVPPRQTDN